MKVDWTIRVKLIARGMSGIAWAAQTPGGEGRWRECCFIFDPSERDYDWLVVIDDGRRRYVDAAERLACADARTLLVTSETPTITRYGRAFTSQFAHVLTRQDAALLPHRSRVYSHTGNLWFCGRSRDEMASGSLPRKMRSISTVCSSKQRLHSIHGKRYRFTHWLKERIPELDIIGNGVRYIVRKHLAVEPYRFHLAIGNHVAPHHWTEKLADSYLCGAVPIYYGCPNVDDYFPEESFVAIDISDYDAATETIRSLLDDAKSHAKRANALQEARRLVLHNYNLLATLNRFICSHFNPNLKASGRPLYGRKRMRCRNPGDIVGHAFWEIRKQYASFRSS